MASIQPQPDSGSQLLVLPIEEIKLFNKKMFNNGKKEINENVGSSIEQQYASPQVTNPTNPILLKHICRCGRSFTHDAHIRYHQRWECGQLLTCRKCCRTYNTKSNLARHLKSCLMDSARLA